MRQGGCSTRRLEWGGATFGGGEIAYITVHHFKKYVLGSVPESIMEEYSPRRDFTKEGGGKSTMETLSIRGKDRRINGRKKKRGGNSRIFLPVRYISFNSVAT